MRKCPECRGKLKFEKVKKIRNKPRDVYRCPRCGREVIYPKGK